MKDLKDALKKKQQERAIKADLVYIPNDMKERCSNCTFISKTGYCQQKDVDQQIEHPDQECCGFWDNKAIDRSKTQGEDR